MNGTGWKYTLFDKPVLSLPKGLARIIHERFYCNRQHTAATSWQAAVRPASGQARPS